MWQIRWGFQNTQKAQNMVFYTMLVGGESLMCRFWFGKRFWTGQKCVETSVTSVSQPTLTSHTPGGFLWQRYEVVCHRECWRRSGRIGPRAEPGRCHHSPPEQPSANRHSLPVEAADQSFSQSWATVSSGFCHQLQTLDDRLSYEPWLNISNFLSFCFNITHDG